jgi:hypothetical protein
MKAGAGMVVSMAAALVMMWASARLSRPNVRARERRLIRPNASATSTLIKTTTRLITSNLSAVLFMVGAATMPLILGGRSLASDMRFAACVEDLAAVLFGLNLVSMCHCVFLTVR